jgi:hypothetical protein
MFGLPPTGMSCLGWLQTSQAINRATLPYPNHMHPVLLASFAGIMTGVSAHNWFKV